MSLRLDLKILTQALGLAQQLATGGHSLEASSLLRELLASLVGSPQFRNLLHTWIAPASLSVAAAATSFAGICKGLPAITGTLAASGFAGEAVRVMATGVGVAPELGSKLFEAAGIGLATPLT